MLASGWKLMPACIITYGPKMYICRFWMLRNVEGVYCCTPYIKLHHKPSKQKVLLIGGLFPGLSCFHCSRNGDQTVSILIT